VQLLLQRGANVNARCKKGSTPLHVAAAMDSLGIVQLLLRNGARRDLQTNDGRTAFDISRGLANPDLSSLRPQQPPSPPPSFGDDPHDPHLPTTSFSGLKV
jgi:ankyrin repeat protein